MIEFIINFILFVIAIGLLLGVVIGLMTVTGVGENKEPVVINRKPKEPIKASADDVLQIQSLSNSNF